MPVSKGPLRVPVGHPVAWRTSTGPVTSRRVGRESVERMNILAGADVLLDEAPVRSCPSGRIRRGVRHADPYVAEPPSDVLGTTVSGRKKPQLGVKVKEWERRNDSASKRRQRQPADDFTDDLHDAEPGDDDSP